MLQSNTQSKSPAPQCWEKGPAHTCPGDPAEIQRAFAQFTSDTSATLHQGLFSLQILTESECGAACRAWTGNKVLEN
ncbi:hypothetical protein AV530_019135 [Patagioenas fasciata monilis]|uniref:Uncharacterized protein n=1 Tax=Patagioenas fasciata monilis TaxID=372326 RepID=A0A1V4KXB9_PATFA|nr:hypothetical protein AV530_019135 [Patagioenas fasciata monilis]